MYIHKYVHTYIHTQTHMYAYVHTVEPLYYGHFGTLILVLIKEDPSIQRSFNTLQYYTGTQNGVLNIEVFAIQRLVIERFHSTQIHMYCICSLIRIRTHVHNTSTSHTYVHTYIHTKDMHMYVRTSYSMYIAKYTGMYICTYRTVYNPGKYTYVRTYVQYMRTYTIYRHMINLPICIYVYGVYI